MTDSFMDGITPDVLQTFEDEGYSDEEVLLLAQGLLLEAIPCLNSIYEKFTDAQKLTIKFAVLEMAKYIKIDYFNFDRATSPFQSETIGSYTYSKMANNVRLNVHTGVPGFDRAVTQFAGLCDVDGGIGAAQTTSEQVFKPGYDRFIHARESLGHNDHYPNLPTIWPNRVWPGGNY